MLESIKNLFAKKTDPEELIIYARAWVDYDSKEDQKGFTLKKIKVSYDVPFTTHVSEIAYFYAVPQEQWTNKQIEEVYVKTRSGYSYFLMFNYLKLQEKFLLYYHL